MRILVTNDDGIHAHGLKVLEAIARSLSDDVLVVAPEADQSGVGHSLSLSDPLRLREIGENRFALKGTPTDCVVMGARRLAGERKIDLVLSGVNRGQNVAEDITYSGTVAAAIEGALMGAKAIALSQAYRGGAREKMHWDCAETHGAKVVRDILAAGIAEGGLVNVNFPPCAADSVTGVAVTEQGRRDTDLLRVEERHDGRGFPYYWLMFKRGSLPPGAESDVAAMAADKISVTPLTIDFTDRSAMARLKAALHRP